jgi:hypothetical protein
MFSEEKKVVEPIVRKWLSEFRMQTASSWDLAHLLMCHMESMSCSGVARMHDRTAQAVARWVRAFRNTNAHIHVLKDKEVSQEYR